MLPFLRHNKLIIVRILLGTKPVLEKSGPIPNPCPKPTNPMPNSMTPGLLKQTMPLNCILL